MTRNKPLTLADISATEREHLELCIHEAAHSVATVAYSGTIRSAVVASGRVIGIQGLTTLDEMPIGREAEIAYAGSYGQAKFRAGGGRPTAHQLYAVFDTTGRKDAATLSLAGGTYLGHGVKPLIDRCWPAVVRVAQELHRTGEVRQADVLAALGIADGGGLTSVQLASMRSGGRVVPPITARKLVPA